MSFKFLLPLGLYDKTFFKSKLDDNWKKRIQDVVQCPDNALIPRYPRAGVVKNGKQVMHNGIVVTLGSYYGDAIVQMLQQNKGVHEPQEEYAFDQVLNTMPAGATMVELGAYWSFYSIWFNKKVSGAKNFLVEPDVINMMYGINNMKLNKAKGKFTNAFVGRLTGTHEGTPVICLDDYVNENHIQSIDILHADIQGFEYDMLAGSVNTIQQHKIKYVFISTHGNEVHRQCIGFLKENNFLILCEADEEDTFSLDGLIVARYKKHDGLSSIRISKKTQQV